MILPLFYLNIKCINVHTQTELLSLLASVTLTASSFKTHQHLKKIHQVAQSRFIILYHISYLQVFRNPSGMITVSHLDMNTEYCGVALYELTHPSIKRQSENTTFCVTLPGKNRSVLFIFCSLWKSFLWLRHLKRVRLDYSYYSLIGYEVQNISSD